MIQYMDILRYLNKANVGNTCSLCLTNNVTIYFNPCGHTSCEECYKKMIKDIGFNNAKCAVCRKDIFDCKKLYYI